MEGMMLFYFYYVPQQELSCLIFRLYRFDFQPEFFHIHDLYNLILNFINISFKFRIYGGNSFDT